jgi:hypothetical protein
MFTLKTSSLQLGMNLRPGLDNKYTYSTPTYKRYEQNQLSKIGRQRTYKTTEALQQCRAFFMQKI